MLSRRAFVRRAASGLLVPSAALLLPAHVRAQLLWMSGGRGSAPSGEGGEEPSGFPDSTNTGPENHPSYPGSLTNNGTSSFSSSNTYNFQRFTSGADITGGTIVFNGCEFLSNAIDFSNVRIFGASAKSVTFNYCRFRPPLSVTIPNADWPCAGADVAGLDGGDSGIEGVYQIAYGDGYQYGIRIENGNATTVIDHCDIWGFGNAIDLPGGSNTTITNCWIHDASWEGPNTEYHTDGPGYLDGGAGPNNVLVQNCTIASLGNTNAIAFQAATSGYDGIVVDGCYLTGFGVTVDMCHGESFATNCKFINNIISNRVLPVFAFLRGDEPTVFAVSKPTNEWRNNRWEITRNSHGKTTADNGKFIHPDGSASTTDYVDGFEE